MLAVLTCIFVQHDLRLVVVAALICVTACCTAFGFHARSAQGSGLLSRAWLALTGLVAGSGVWATHFMAMLAYQPSLRIGYDLSETALSLAAAVAGMGLGFAVPVWRRGERGANLIGGALTGCSVAVMHYIGIAAIRTQALMQWDLRYVAASILIGAAGGMAAFSLRNRVKGAWAFAPPAGVLVLGIVGLHFTAMTAVTLLPDAAIAAPAHVVGRDGLAIATIALTALIMLAGGSLVLMERLGRNSTFISLRDALNAVPSGIAFYDPSGRLGVWNAAYAALMSDCGVTCQVGDHRRGYLEAAAKAGWFSATSDELAASDLHAPADGSEFQRPDGRWLRHETFETDDGGVVTVLTDITEQKETAVAMASARDAAEAANRAKTEFLANISHEIRTPLNGVLGFADVLMGTRLSGAQRGLVGAIQKSGGVLDGLLSDVLDLTRIEAGVVQLHAQTARLSDLAASVTEPFAQRALEKGLDLRVEMPAPADAEVTCDPVKLRKVLNSLISNALKFTDAGEVVLSVNRTGERVAFAVGDTGRGFDVALTPVLLQRFGQADSSGTREHGGAGLGLAICNDYLRLMGAELVCHSVPGQGSTFSFELTLPLASAPGEAGGPILAIEPGVFRVLVVDDNAANRQVAELILASVGIDHASVVNGREAVDAVMAGGFDAVLMDIQMPVMDGLEATRRIRAWEREGGHERTPVIIVSANGLAEHVEAGRAAGADDHLGKPISPAGLLAALTPRLEAAA